MRLWIGAVSLLISVVPALTAKSPLTAEAMLKIKRLSEPAVSPDGKWVAFTVGVVDVEGNRTQRQIWLTGLEGGTPRALTSDGQNSGAKWSPDSKRIAFLSTRGGSSQVWTMDADGSSQRQITKISTEAEGLVWGKDGKTLLFTSAVYPTCTDDACNQKKLDAEKQSKVKAKVYTSLLYRHWSEWEGARRKHLFTVPADGGTPKDATPGLPYHVPPFSLSGGADYDISPDGKEIVYAYNAEENQAFSTNWDLFAVPAEGGPAKKLTESAGADASPQFSPDGKFLAWRMQVRGGYESDRWRLVVMDRTSGQVTNLTENMDRHVTGFTWHPDSKRIAFITEDRGRAIAQMMPIAGGGTRVILQGASHVDDLQFTSDAKTLIFSENSGSSPTEILKASSGGGPPVALTRLNEDLLKQHELNRFEDFTVTGAEGAQVHSFLLKPPAFDGKKKYPVLVLIHGGPQGAWGESWSYRWNPQVFAAAGFVVVMPNPRGSTGYGSKFTDEINEDWGGRAYEDIMAVTDNVAALPFVDKERMAAAGGSYGGYMVNWILGHSDRFKALVSHAGVYDLNSMGGETEELWFTNWEFKGMPWQNPSIYEKWSPSKYAASFKTPTLVIHGELDYRVPAGQGMQLFTALQAQKIPSKMLLYPDEGHWILKPQNSLLWYKTFLEWVTEWTRPKK
jgi:dipeptidyl aminopeptidase/acylaminoacyl peptidase